MIELKTEINEGIGENSDEKAENFAPNKGTDESTNLKDFLNFRRSKIMGSIGGISDKFEKGNGKQLTISNKNNATHFVCYDQLDISVPKEVIEKELNGIERLEYRIMSFFGKGNNFLKEKEKKFSDLGELLDILEKEYRRAIKFFENCRNDVEESYKTLLVENETTINEYNNSQKVSTHLLRQARYLAEEHDMIIDELEQLKNKSEKAFKNNNLNAALDIDDSIRECEVYLHELKDAFMEANTESNNLRRKSNILAAFLGLVFIRRYLAMEEKGVYDGLIKYCEQGLKIVDEAKKKMKRHNVGGDVDYKTIIETLQQIGSYRNLRQISLVNIVDTDNQEFYDKDKKLGEVVKKDREIIERNLKHYEKELLKESLNRQRKEYKRLND